MGKLIEKLDRMQRASGPRLGFGASEGGKGPSLALIAALPSPDPKTAAAAVENGASAILVRQAGKKAGPLGQALSVADSVPCGAVWDDGTQTEGLDFAVLDAGQPIGALLDLDKVDRVLRLERHASDEVLRTLESLPIDGYLLPEPPAPLTLQGLMEYYRAARATTKPVLAAVPVSASPAVLRALRDAGIGGLLVETQNAGQAKGLAELRKAVDGLPPPRRSKSIRPRASISMPGVAAQAAPAPDEDDDDEE